jgi:hypothetical protein
MPLELALPGALITTSLCYTQGLLLGCWLTRGIASPPAKSREELERQLRVEIRDTISKIALARLEAGEELTLCQMIEHCPTSLSGGKLREMWLGESYQILNQVLGEDFKTY